MTDIAELGLVVRSDGVVVAKDRLNALSDSASRTQKSVDLLTRALGLLGAALSINQIVQLTSAWTDLNSRVLNVVGSHERATAAMARIEAMARTTYTSLNQTAETFLLNARSLQELGYSADKTFDFVESLNDALVVSGAKGDRAAAVMDAFSKAIGLGKLQGDQLNVILASGGRVAQALADGLGVTTNQLRQMGAQGQLTADKIIPALVSQLQKLRKEANDMPATIMDSFTLLGNAVEVFIGKVDAATGASSNIAGFIIGIADGLEASTGTAIQFVNFVEMGMAALAPIFQTLVDHIDLAKIGFIALAAAAGLLAVAIGQTLVGAVVALGAALLANPIGLFIAAIAAAVTAIFLFRDDLKKIFGVDIVDIIKTAANFVIGLWVGAFHSVMDTWGLLPEAFHSLFIKAMNFAIDAVQNGINGITGALRKIPGLGDKIGDVDLSGFKGTPSNVDSNVGSTISKDMTDAQSTDYVGNMASSLQKVWDSAKGATDQIGSLSGSLSGKDGLAGAMGAANDNTKAFRDMMSSVSDLLTDDDPFVKLQKNLDTLGALLNAGKISWEQYGSAVSKANLNAASSVLDSVGQITSTLSDAFKDNKALAVANAVINTAEGITKALAQGGMFAWPSAIAIGVAGAAQIASILSAQPGSGSTAGVSGDANNAPAAPTATQGGAINITLKGDGMISTDSFMKQITQQIDAGHYSDFIKVVKAA